jgi:hypothetical protein
VSAPQYDLCREVLRRLDAAGVLDRVILIGSWCLLAYREYFGRRALSEFLRLNGSAKGWNDCDCAAILGRMKAVGRP